MNTPTLKYATARPRASSSTRRLRLRIGARAVSTVAALVVSLGAVAPALGQDAEPELGGKNATEFGWVISTGNAQTSTINVRNVYEYAWAAANLNWEFGLLRADSGDDRFAVGTEDDFEVIEPPVETDNARIHTNLRYLRDINPKVFWYGRFFYERDEPADINYRITPSFGAGNNWKMTDELTFRTLYGLSYTSEELKLDGASSYAGYQLLYELLWTATENTTVDSNLTFDGSIEDASNYRFDWLNGVGVSITDTLALRASLRLVYRNDPALEDLDLEDALGLGIVIGSVIVPKKKLDTAFTTSLVVNF